MTTQEILLHAEETDTTPYAGTTESTLQTYELAANTYDYIKVEFLLDLFTLPAAISAVRCDWTIRLKAEGSTIRTWTMRTLAQGTGAQDGLVTNLSHILTGGQEAATDLDITIERTDSRDPNGATPPSAHLKCFRVYGFAEDFETPPPPTSTGSFRVFILD